MDVNIQSIASQFEGYRQVVAAGDLFEFVIQTTTASVRILYYGLTDCLSD
jgi:hypothetical protein